MARIRAILAALITAERRDLKTLGSFSGSNLFVAGVTFLFLGDSGVFVALTAFIGLVLFIPLSADPLRVLPPDRIAVWPIGTAERRWLRILSPWLNPVTWLIAALAVWKHVSMGLWALAAGVFAMGFLLPSLPAARNGTWRHLPDFPGPLNHLIRKDLRETLSTLDFWCSAVVSALCLGFRAAGLLPAEALLPMTILVMLGQRCAVPFGVRTDDLASGSRCRPRRRALGSGDGPSRFRDPPQRPNALAVLQRHLLRYEHFSGRRDLRDRRSRPRDTAPSRPLRGRLCVVHVVVRAGGGATAAVALVHDIWSLCRARAPVTQPRYAAYRKAHL